MATIEEATFAAGCFWGVQYYFDQIPGVITSTVGYTGGHVEDPTYEEVCTHTTGHAEAVELQFDPTNVDYEMLVRHFFRMHDPTQLNKQGPDIGDSYRSAIFYRNDTQKDIAINLKQQLQTNYDKAIVTLIEPASVFYKAEEYHQKFAQRTGRGMCHIPYEPIN